MASKKNINFGSSFKSAVKRGTPAATAVWNIANKTGNSESFVWNWLFKNDFVNRKKFGANFIYWPTFDFKAKSNQNNKPFCVQSFVNWAIANGYCSPEQVNHLKSQKDFVNFFGPFFAAQFGWNVSSGWSASKAKNFGKSSSRSSTSKRKSSSKRHSPKRKRAATSTKSKSTRKSSAKRSTSGSRKSVSKRRARTTTARSYKFPRSNSRSVRRAA